jgi:hypothetical protein
MAVLVAVALSVGSFLVFAFLLRWLILGRMPQGIALLGREVESLRERVARLEEEAARREQSPSS